MVAETEVLHQSIPVLDIVQYRCIAKEISAATSSMAATTPSSPPAPPAFHQMAAAASGEPAAPQQLELSSPDAVLDVRIESAVLDFIPSIRSGSFADIGHRRDMEDEHICIDDLSTRLGSMISCPAPSAFYGVFDGHGGPDAAAYLRKHAMRLFFEDADFPQASQADDVFLQEVENSVKRSFLLVDDTLADDRTVSSSSGTTALTAFVFGRVLLVANAGDCRAVLCRKGEALEMSEDHRPVRSSERKRIEAVGGFIEDGYLNGVLSVSRALGDWDMKIPRGSPSPLIAEPEFRQALLTEDDEFLIIGCDGIWDVMSSQHAVSVVRRGLQRHDNPERCARELVMEALRLNTFDNLTVIIVCFSSEQRVLPSPLQSVQPLQRSKLRCCSLSAEALCNLKSWLNQNDSN